MKLSILILLVLDVICSASEVTHEVSCVVGCTENSTEAEVLCTFDSEQIFYTDFQAQELVYTVPEYINYGRILYFDHEELLKTAIDGKKVCPKILTEYDVAEGHQEEPENPPECLIYPAEQVLLGDENTLVCFVNSFYPPSTNITWTKNLQPVSRHVSVSQYYPNKDHTFYQMSTLKFLPEEGDVYTCSVAHKALEKPNTKHWEVKFKHPSIVPDVICGLGLTSGVVLIAAGAVLAFKEKVTFQKGVM